MLTYSQQQLCLQMKTNHKQDTDMLSPLAFFFFPTRFHFFSSFYSFPLFPSYDFVCLPRHCENNRWGTSWWCVFLCVRAQWVCLIEMLIGSNETSAIMWLQTRFPNKRRMLSVASRVFHWNHTFIQPVSCPGVFLSAWADEEREPSVSLSCSLLFPLSLSPPSPHPSSHPFHHPPPPPQSVGVSWCGLSQLWLSFSLLDRATLPLEWKKAHDSQSESDQFWLIAEEMVVD